uniref:coiled-coil domain-containing protein 158-like isoform X3 n=1 Tax=Doryrhamphus excisus TaxID=161450 RepID=UPI0025AE76E9|nr:coiled-coil domain-containing protein 158-like isoform X3 [Doryrhamphus excisus]
MNPDDIIHNPQRRLFKKSAPNIYCPVSYSYSRWDLNLIHAQTQTRAREEDAMIVVPMVMHCRLAAAFVDVSLHSFLFREVLEAANCNLPFNNIVFFVAFENADLQHNVMDLKHRTTTRTSTQDTSGLKFNSLTLDELNEELERRTKETQLLLEEVENATKFTLERFGSTGGHTCITHSTSCDSAQQRDATSTRDVMSNLRVTDSRGYIDQMEKLLHLLEEVQVIKRSGDQKLQEGQLNKKVEALEVNIKEFCQEFLSCKITATGPKEAVPTVTDDYLNDVLPRPDPSSSEPQQPVEHVKSECRQTERRMAQLIASVGQEAAMLNHKLSSSKDSGARISTKLELLRRLLRQHEVLLGPLEEVQTPGGEQDVTKEEKKQHQTQCGSILAENETLRLKLVDKEKLVELLRSQLDRSNQTIAQHSCTMAGLHQENILLSEQLKQHKQEMQQLKTHLAAAESQQVETENLEKQQLITQLEVQHRHIAVAEEHKALQQLHSCTNEEHRGVVLRLQGRLKSAQTELDRVRSTPRTLEGNGAAMDMQKGFTARRQQTDTLKARVQHREEAVKKLDQERSYQNVENQHQVPELAFVKEEKRQLAHELDAVRSKDKLLRERICELEAILHKMTESFANCQDFMQLKEQEFFRLKLEHLLDLKEFQGQNVTPPGLDSLTLPALSDLQLSMQDACNRQMKERQESPARARQGGPPSDNAATPKRRSAPARANRPAFSSIEQVETVKAARRRKTCGSETHFPKKMAELDAARDSHVRSPLASAAKNAFFPTRRLLSGRRSPVHALLTSDPAHSWQTQQQRS